MLYHRRNKMVIFTPTKTGTMTTEKTLRDAPHNKLTFTYVPRHMSVMRHSMIPPDAMWGYQRVMLFRNPVERMFSIFFHIGRRQVIWSHMWQFTDDFTRFMEQLMDIYDDLDPKEGHDSIPYVYANTLTDQLYHCSNNGLYPVTLLRTEHLKADLYELTGHEYDVPVVNKCRATLEESEAVRSVYEGMRKKLKNRIENWLGEDLELYNKIKLSPELTIYQS